MSSGVRVSTAMIVKVSAAPVVSISWRSLVTDVEGFTSNPILVTPGIRSRANSSCFAGQARP